MKKANAKKAAEDFIEKVHEIKEFVDSKNLAKLSKKHITWAHEYAVIRLYREFEDMILKSLIAAINIDTDLLKKRTGIDFPKHINCEACQYIIVRDGYFNFRGRDGLIGTLKKFVPKEHYLVKIVKNEIYREPLDRLSAFRNFAAHYSKPARTRALEAVGGNRKRLASAGAWLKTQNRFGELCRSLINLANEIKNRPQNQDQQ